MGIITTNQPKTNQEKKMNYTAQGHTTIRRARKGDKGDPGVGVASADVVFCVADSQTDAPADTAQWKTLFKQLALGEGKYVWQATRITYTTAIIAMTGKQCLGRCEDFAAVTEMYALGDSPTEAPASGWATTYTPAKGKWLWTRNRLLWSDGSITYTTAACIGYMGDDGDAGNGIAAMRSLFALTDRQAVADFDDLDAWQATLPQPTEQEPYVWMTVETTFTSGSTTHSTPTLAALWQAGANANLLDNAAFVSDDRIGAWTVRSTYNAVSGQTPPSTDPHGVSTSQRVQGRNSYADTNSATADVANYKETLQQTVHDPAATTKTAKLTAAQWHTLSFWARRASDTTLMSDRTFTDGGLITDMAASVKLRLIAGQNITIAATGHINAQASKLSATLRVRLALGSTEIAHGDIATVGTGTVAITGKGTINAAIATSGEYTLTAMLYKPTATSGTSESTATLATLTITDDHDLTTYLYTDGASSSDAGAIDTATKPIIDGKEHSTALGDLGINWRLTTEWTRHTVTFKTAARLPATSAAHVLFRLQPAMATGTQRQVWISQPKLETGMVATAFIDTADDAKGDKGDEGVQGMVCRVSEWAVTVSQYRNDTDNPDGDTDNGGIRYIDIVTVTNTNGEVVGCYRCKKTHAPSSDNKPGQDTAESKAKWETFNTMQPIYTPLLVADNAVMRFSQTNRLLITDTAGETIQGCLQGVSSADMTPLWMGGKTASEANFRVAYDGTLTATNANISGTVRASNFYHNVRIFNDSRTDNDSYFITANNNPARPDIAAGWYYTFEQLYGTTDNPLDTDDISYLTCTGLADIILLRDESVADPDSKAPRTVVLPRAEDFEGKIIEIVDLNRYGYQYARKIRLACIGQEEIADGEYSNTFISHIYANWTSGATTLDMTIGTRLRLLSVKVDGCFYWLVIDEAKSEGLT